METKRFILTWIPEEGIQVKRLEFATLKEAEAALKQLKINRRIVGWSSKELYPAWLHQRLDNGKHIELAEIKKGEE